MFVKIEDNIVTQILDDKPSGKGKYIELPVFFEHFITLNTEYKNKNFVVDLNNCKSIAKDLIKNKRKDELNNSIVYDSNKYPLSTLDIFKSKTSGFIYKFDDGTFIELPYSDVLNITNALESSNQNLFNIEYEADSQIDKAKTLLDISGYCSFYYRKNWSVLDNWEMDFKNTLQENVELDSKTDPIKVNIETNDTSENTDIINIRDIILNDPEIINLIATKIKSSTSKSKTKN